LIARALTERDSTHNECDLLFLLQKWYCKNVNLRENGFIANYYQLLDDKFDFDT